MCPVESVRLQGRVTLWQNRPHGTLLGDQTRMANYREIITIEPGKRAGKPCIRGMRITVYDVLSYLAAGMSGDEVLMDFPMLTIEDIQACLAYAADRERLSLVRQA